MGSYLYYDYQEYGWGFLEHIISPEHRSQLVFHTTIFLLPFMTTYLGYLLSQKDKLLKKAEQAEAELKQINRRLEDLAKTDGLTGLRNHRYFYTRLEQEMSRAQRYGHPLSVIILDVDYFKHYNDANGHLMGDHILRDLASCLKISMRENDLVARYGGDEFSVILPETGKAAAMEIGERIRDLVSEHAFLNRESQPGGKVTISLGVATFPEDAADIKRLVGQADDALYVAKKTGRDSVEAASENEGEEGGG